MTTCKKCGTCCTKGGPALHKEDLSKVQSGVICISQLFTIRAKEPVWDNVLGVMSTAGTDVVKIKGTKNSPLCSYYDGKAPACRIYGNRPAECRALKCWDTAAVEEMYAKNRLTRRDILAAAESLCDLIDAHQQYCDYDNINRLCHGIVQQNDWTGGAELTKIIRYDENMRQLVIKQAGISVDILDFLFGRPVAATLRMFSLELRNSGRHLQFRRLPGTRPAGRSAPLIRAGEE
ncbi:MAG: YkgJ family cysteine cluster protein [Desulfobacteraceae bacterium]|nr:YkgJ family cysteine cluster protein [Desulfobacteraceae bacterium]